MDGDGNSKVEYTRILEVVVDSCSVGMSVVPWTVRVRQLVGVGLLWVVSSSH
jgi:hypothetical protein